MYIGLGGLVREECDSFSADEIPGGVMYRRELISRPRLMFSVGRLVVVDWMVECIMKISGLVRCAGGVWACEAEC